MEYLVLTSRARRCRVCREWTRWTPQSFFRSDWGLCLDHADGYPCEDAPRQAGDALRNLRAVFPQMEAGRAPEIHAEPQTVVGGTWKQSGTSWLRSCPPPRTDPREPHERRRKP